MYMIKYSGGYDMEIAQVFNNNIKAYGSVASLENSTIKSSVATKSNEASSSVSPLSGKYTYAMGQDGKRYILQLRIDIATMSTFSKLA